MIVAYGFSIFMLAAGLIITIYGLLSVFKAWSVKNWRETKGKISKSKVDSYISNTSDMEGTTMYVATIEYDYEVNGTQYEGNRVRMGMGASSSKKGAAKMVEKFYRSRVVPVYYNPVDPSKSVLERKASRWIYAPLIMGILMSAISGGLLWNLMAGNMTLESDKRGEERQLN